MSTFVRQNEVKSAKIVLFLWNSLHFTEVSIYEGVYQATKSQVEHQKRTSAYRQTVRSRPGLSSLDTSVRSFLVLAVSFRKLIDRSCVLGFILSMCQFFLAQLRFLNTLSHLEIKYLLLPILFTFFHEFLSSFQFLLQVVLSMVFIIWFIQV